MTENATETKIWMTEIPCLSSFRPKRGKICSLLVSSIVFTSGWVGVPTIEYRYSNTDSVHIELTVDIVN